MKKLILLFLLIPSFCYGQVETGGVFYINTNNAIIYTSSDMSTPADTLSVGLGVLVKASERKWSLITYSGENGYINTDQLSPSLNEARLQMRRRLVFSQGGLSEVTKQKILNGVVWIGMSDRLAELSWGKPSEVNRTITANMTREQWVYHSYNRKSKYLYFENGELVTIQE